MNGEVNRNFLFQDIVYHRYDGTEVKEQDAFITTRTGKKRRRETPKGLNYSSNGRMVSQHDNDRQGYENLIPCAYG